MTRQNQVSVRLKTGISGRVTHCAGPTFDLSLEPGAVAGAWGNGSPITAQEFAAVLQPTGLFEMVVPKE